MPERASAATAASLRLGVDIGGTFTDFALVDGDGRRLATHKQLTTPRDPAAAVLEGTHALLEAARAVPADIAEVVHGTTLVTNALIERRGARVGMLVTEGFRDLFDIGQEQRYDLFDLRLRFAEPLVPRERRAEATERLRHDGAVLMPLDEEAVRRSLRRLVEQEQIESLAICFLHSYADDRHEARAAEIARDLYPGVPVSRSAEIYPFRREFERWTTACANAYAQPLVDRYLSRLEGGFAEVGIAGRLWVMSSSGGLMTPEAARRFPVRLLESGPAAGVLMAARLGREAGRPDVLSFDLGGTTAKGALVRAGRPLRRDSFEAAHAYEHRSGSGLPLQIPVLDMIEIGSGGGSLAAPDALGRIRVGPRSAAAEPGPACYGRGGTGATLTDANLALGYLDPAFFLGGRLRLDAAAASRAIEGSVGAPLALDATRAAWGIHEIANEDIARAFRAHASERGLDLRRCSMLAFGGGGPIHAGRIARKLRVPEVVYPVAAGVMSALGMLAGAQSFEVTKPFPRPLDDLAPGDLTAAMDELGEQAASHLLAGGLPRAAIAFERRIDMKYAGQGYAVELLLPTDRDPVELAPSLPELFAARYREVYGAPLEEPVEIVGLKVAALGPAPERFGSAECRDEDSAGRHAAALKGVRLAYFPGAGFLSCPVYDRRLLRPGTSIDGPALVEEPESTCLLDPGDRATLDERDNLVARIGAAA